MVKRCGLRNVQSLASKRVVLCCNQPQPERSVIALRRPRTGDCESCDTQDSRRTMPMPLPKDWLSPLPIVLKVHFLIGASPSPFSYMHNSVMSSRSASDQPRYCPGMSSWARGLRHRACSVTSFSVALRMQPVRFLDTWVRPPRR